MLKEELEMSNVEDEVSKIATEFVRTKDKFVLKNLDSINHAFVGWKVAQLDDKGISNFFTENCYLKVQIPMEFIGFDDEEGIEYYNELGYNVCRKKDLEKIREVIK